MSLKDWIRNLKRGRRNSKCLHCRFYSNNETTGKLIDSRGKEFELWASKNRCMRLGIEIPTTTNGTGIPIPDVSECSLYRKK